MKSTYYITTPIYYVNGVPHIGSSTTTLLCDAIARYRRLRGEPVFFLTGTDEHAQKVADAAAKVGRTALEFTDDVSQRFVEAWRLLNISNDDFIRTTEPRHKEVVNEVFRRLQATGDIYAGQYEGWYSVADETFFRDSEVKDGRAIESGAEVERVTEDVYYFKLSAYGDRLLGKIESDPHFLLPDTRRNEVIAFIKGGLRDLAISRRNTNWGIPVPNDPHQVIYVWFDACINYLSATGWPTSPHWDDIWPADVHMVGKEIYTRFHATLWPAMLMALGLELPRHVVGHGWWLVGGKKGSKREGNIPTPQAAVDWLREQSGEPEAVAVDALRYYLIRDISFTSDSEFTYETLLKRHNDDLANDLGNLLNRTLNMVKQYLGSVVPEGAAERTANGTLRNLALEVAAEVERAMDAIDPGAALVAIWKLVKAGNMEIDASAPWKKQKEGDADGVADALYVALEANRIIATLLSPFLPHASDLILTQIGLYPAAVRSWETATKWGVTPAGLTTQEARPIFPRIVKKEAAPAQPPAAAKEKPKAVTTESETIEFAQFAQVQLRIAEIVTAERIEGATKLLKLTIDIGEEEPRQLVAGIAESYEPESLPGRKIVVVANLKPARIRGVESNGMLLAATDEDGKAILLTPDNAGIPAGAKVK